MSFYLTIYSKWTKQNKWTVTFFSNKCIQCFVSALWKKMRSQIWWMDEFGILRPFQQYFSHIGTMDGRTWKALCNEVPSMFGKNLSSSGIRTRDPWSEVGTARKPNLRPTTLPLFNNLTRGSYGNRQNVPRIKTEQYSKYIFNINPLAFFYET